MQQVPNVNNQASVQPKKMSFIGDVSTKAIVASVLLGVLMAVLEQVAERVDTIAFAGVFPVFGIIIANTIALIGVLTFGWVGGLLAVEINPIVAVATATGPLAPLWFVTNFAQVTGNRVVMHMIGKKAEDLSFWETFGMCCAGTLLNCMVMFPVQLLYFKMPPVMIASMVGLTFAVGTIIPTIIARKVSVALRRSRLAA